MINVLWWLINCKIYNYAICIFPASCHLRIPLGSGRWDNEYWWHLECLKPYSESLGNLVTKRIGIYSNSKTSKHIKYEPRRPIGLIATYVEDPVMGFKQPGTHEGLLQFKGNPLRPRGSTQNVAFRPPPADWFMKQPWHWCKDHRLSCDCRQSEAYLQR